MTILSFDELERLGKERQSLEFEQYFGEMDIDRQQRRKRMELAEDLEDAFILFYLWYEDTEPQDAVRRKVREAIDDSLDGNKYPRNERTEDTVDAIAESIADTTRKRREDPFTFSEDRAKESAEDISNTFWNDAEYEEAVDRRRKFKMWHTIMDGRERAAHGLADGQMVEIDEPFVVGDELMMFPKDTSLGASLDNIINCRCTVEYIG